MESNIKEMTNFSQIEDKEKRSINVTRRKKNKNIYKIIGINKTILKKKTFENNIQLVNYLFTIKLFIFMNY